MSGIKNHPPSHQLRCFDTCSLFSSSTIFWSHLSFSITEDNSLCDCESIVEVT